jgi:hypothetical protein
VNSILGDMSIGPRTAVGKAVNAVANKHPAFRDEGPPDSEQEISASIRPLRRRPDRDLPYTVPVHDIKGRTPAGVVPAIGSLPQAHPMFAELQPPQQRGSIGEPRDI